MTDRAVDAAADGPAHRAIPVITGELREVEHHLREVPPHHGGGTGDLAARADALRRELAAAHAAHRAAATPPRRPGTAVGGAGEDGRADDAG